MVELLGKRIKEEYSDLICIAQAIDKPYRQGFVKNRYVGRTFIISRLDSSSVRSRACRKLNAIRSEFKDKNVLLVDDSIVRGTTSEQIIEMARGLWRKQSVHGVSGSRGSSP